MTSPRPAILLNHSRRRNDVAKSRHFKALYTLQADEFSVSY
jgi:hypothetical protein